MTEGSDHLRRLVLTIYGSIDALSMAEGLPVRFDVPARSVSLVGGSIALVVGPARPGERNRLILGPAGDELARLGTTCATGYIDQALDVLGEVRVIEATPHGLFQVQQRIAELTRQLRHLAPRCAPHDHAIASVQEDLDDARQRH